MDMSEIDVPESFRVYVTEELAKECMGEEILRLWGITKQQQHFCYVLTKV